MAEASYSHRLLTDKLGLGPDMNIALIGVPEYYEQHIGSWPLGSSISWELSEPSFDFIHYFTKQSADLARDIVGLVEHLDSRGMLWVSWPKQASGVTTDMTEQTIRDLALPLGVVDTKVCSVDNTWSGLKLVWRKGNR
jgi:Protein of unknown function (DUF3052)